MTCPGTLQPVKLPSLLVVAAIAIAACDPTLAAAIDNQSDQTILVGRIYSVGGEPGLDVLVAGPHERTTIGTYGVGRQELLERVVLMSESCEILANQPIWADFSEGGVITVAPDHAIDFKGWGNPPSGAPPGTTRACLDTLESLVPRGT